MHPSRQGRDAAVGGGGGTGTRDLHGPSPRGRPWVPSHASLCSSGTRCLHRRLGPPMHQWVPVIQGTVGCPCQVRTSENQLEHSPKLQLQEV